MSKVTWASVDTMAGGWHSCGDPSMDDPWMVHGHLWLSADDSWMSTGTSHSESPMDAETTLSSMDDKGLSTAPSDNPGFLWSVKG